MAFNRSFHMMPENVEKFYLRYRVGGRTQCDPFDSLGQAKSGALKIWQDYAGNVEFLAIFKFADPTGMAEKTMMDGAAINQSVQSSLPPQTPDGSGQLPSPE